MRAVTMEEGPRLALVERPRPTASGHGRVVRIEACVLPRTDLHILDGDFEHPRHPIILGHRILA